MKSVIYWTLAVFGYITIIALAAMFIGVFMNFVSDCFVNYKEKKFTLCSYAETCLGYLWSILVVGIFLGALIVGVLKLDTWLGV